MPYSRISTFSICARKHSLNNWCLNTSVIHYIERRFFICEMLLARHKRKSFLHRIVTGDEKWIHYDNPKKRKSWELSGQHRFNIDSQAEYSWKKTHVVYLVGSVWCRVLWVAQTERDHYWGSLPNTIDEIEPSTQGNAPTTPGMTKLFSCSITCCGAGQNLLRNTQMESSTPPVFSRHCSFWLPLVPIDDAWPV